MDIYTLRMKIDNFISVLFGREKPVFTAWFITLLLWTLMAFIPNEEINHYPSIVDVIWGIVWAIPSLAYLFFFVRICRGNSKTSRKPPYIDVPLNWWSYIWRGMLILWVLQFVYMPIALLNVMKGIKIEGLLLSTIVIFVGVITVPLLTLGIFGVNRREKLAWVKLKLTTKR